MFKYSNISNWMDVMRLTKDKKPLPMLSFPAVQLLYIPTNELVQNSTLQALGIKMIADRYDMPAAIGYMDLSIEAEAFGAHAVYSVDEIPTIIGQLVTDMEEAEALTVPCVGAGRTGIAVEGIKKASRIVTDRPLFAECIGPFSLAGRLMDVNEAMLNCYDDPDMVHLLLEKSTEFIINYIRAFKEAGAHGVIMAEPLAGVLSPQLAREFSSDYVKKIVDEVQSEDFIVIYHNCGSGVVFQADDIWATGCKAFHFGDSINIVDMLEKAPADVLIMGNVSPARTFLAAKPQLVKSTVHQLMTDAGMYENFWPSSGCDIPPLTDLENIEAFFSAVDEFYYKRHMIDLIEGRS